MRAVVVGAGAGGLITGMLLAKDGHEVTILERDGEGPPADNEAAWEDWKRTGVNQLRQPHGFGGRVRQTFMLELPELWESIRGCNTYSVDLKAFSPAAGTPDVEGDELLRPEVMRRSTFERLVALAAENTLNLQVRRGVAVQGLLTKSEAAETPTITGVVTDTGERINGDLVVDAAGRRTPFPKWLRALGSDVTEWSESDGFTYHSMWYRTHDNKYPELTAGLFGGMAPGMLMLVFPGDDGVFGLAMIGLGSDKILRRLRDPEKFTQVAQRMTHIAHWVDPAVADRITDVLSMGAIQNRQLKFRSNGRLSAAGLVNIADSAMATNPSLGRGVGLACVYALELRSLLRKTDDPFEVSSRYIDIQEERLTPFLTDAVQSDAANRRFLAGSLGEPLDDAPPAARTILSQASNVDVDVWRRWSRVNQVLDLPTACTEDEALVQRAREAIEGAPQLEPHLSREALVGILSA
jgi:flavin-dependent dehydrogenase